MEKMLIAKSFDIFTKAVKSLHGELSATPERIVKEMFSKLDEVVDWKNPDLKILDPAAGFGTFLREAYIRLKEFHSEDHILNNMLYACEINGFKTLFLEKKMGLRNIYKGDFLTMKLPEGWPKEFNIVGNPPYKGEGNDKSPSRLWHKFIKKAREIVKEDGYLSFVVPSFYTQVGEGYKIFESSVTSKNLLTYQHKGRAFEGVGIDVCYFLEQNKPYQGNTFFNGKSHDFRNGFVYEGDDAIIKSIIDKVIENGKPKLKLEWVKRDKKECNLDGIGIPVYFSGRKKKWVDEPVGHIDPKGRGVLDSTSWKVIFPCSSSYKGQFVTTESACMLNYYVKVSSELEGNQIMSYTTLPPMVKIASLYKKTSGFTPLVQHRMIPDLERKFWTVEEFYKYHDLTEEEIRVLNS